MSIQKKIQTIIGELNREFYERDRIIEASWAAILSDNHLLQLGPPGTAKSALVQAICGRVCDTKYFQWLLTRFSTPEELFGPISLKSLETDDYRRVTHNKLPEAEIVFLDEIFKGNAAILNSLLTVVNERRFDNGATPMQVPLVSMFGASNELPQEDELNALYDRFMLRFWVPYIQDGSNWEALLRNGKSSNTATILTKDELKLAQNEVMTVTLSAAVIPAMRDIKMRLDRQGITASDRRWKQTISVLKAWAWIHSGTEVQVTDLDLLCDMLWRTPEERTTVVSEVLSVTNPLDLEATRIYDTVVDVYSKWDKANSASTEETAEKIRLAIEKLDYTIKTGNISLLDKTKQTRVHLSGMYKEILRSMNI